MEHNRAADTRRYDELDAYRGLAAVAIVVFHAYTLSHDAYPAPPGGGWTGALKLATFRNLEAGVAFFFVLSGFVISLPFARALVNAAPMPPLLDYAVRRACRLLPAYWVALFAVWWLKGDAFEVGNYWAHATLTNSLFPQYTATILAWSLSNEAIYYALTPPLILLVARWGRGRDRRARIRGYTVVLALLVALSEIYKGIAWLLGLVTLHPGGIYMQGALYFDPVGRGDAFVFGMALALLAAAGVRPQRSRRVALLVAGAGIIAAICWWRWSIGATMLYFQSVVAIGFACIMAATVLAPRSAGGLRVPRPLLALGTVSYGLFLWHGPFVRDLAMAKGVIRPYSGETLATTLWMLLPGLLIGCVTYVLVERPGIALGAWLLSRRAGRAHDPRTAPSTSRST